VGSALQQQADARAPLDAAAQGYQFGSVQPMLDEQSCSPTEGSGRAAQRHQRGSGASGASDAADLGGGGGLWQPGEGRDLPNGSGRQSGSTPQAQHAGVLGVLTPGDEALREPFQNDELYHEQQDVVCTQQPPPLVPALSCGAQQQSIFDGAFSDDSRSCQLSPSV